MNKEELRDLSRVERIETLFESEPTDYQAEVLTFGEEKAKAQTAPKKGRQVGATKTAGFLGADHAITNADTDVLYTAPSQGTANEMFRECKKLFWNSPFDDWKTAFGVTNDNKETWEFANGTRILSRTLGNVEQQNNSGNRGMNPTCVIVDEAAYTKDQVYTEEIEEFFITHLEYEFHLFSTPAGQSGYFYEKVEQEGIRDVDNASDEPYSWYSPYWPTKISPYAQQDFIDKKREEYDEDTFAQEFLGEFKGGGSLISPEVVANCVGDILNAASTPPRYLGIDPAGGGDDRMVIYDLDAGGITHNIWSWLTVDGPEFLDYVTRIVRGDNVPEVDVGTGETTTYDEVVVERNGIGEYGSDFAERDLGNVITPISSGRESKHTLYKRLVRDLEAGDIMIPNFRKLKNQLTSLEKTTTPTGYWKVSHPPGGHDDFPDGLMLANAARTGLAGEFQREIKQSKSVTRTSARSSMQKRGI